MPAGITVDWDLNCAYIFAFLTVPPSPWTYCNADGSLLKWNGCSWFEFYHQRNWCSLCNSYLLHVVDFAQSAINWQMLVHDFAPQQIFTLESRCVPCLCMSLHVSECVGYIVKLQHVVTGCLFLPIPGAGATTCVETLISFQLLEM